MATTCRPVVTSFILRSPNIIRFYQFDRKQCMNWFEQYQDPDMQGTITPEGMTKFMNDMGVSLESVSYYNVNASFSILHTYDMRFIGHSARNKLAIKCIFHGYELHHCILSFYCLK